MDSSIKFNVSANTGQFQSGMRQVDTAAKSTAAGIKTAFAGVGSLLAGGAVAAGLKSLMSDFDRVGKLATRFGTSAESIQRVSVAADIAGTNIEQVANAMTKAGVAASQAVEKGGEMAETFQRAGINAQQFANAQLDQKLLMVAEAFAAAQGDANKTNAIIEILGTRAGANLIPLISNVQALKDEMAGVAVASDQAVRQIEKANDAMTRFGNNVKVLGARLIEDFSLGVQQLTSFFSGTGLKTIAQLQEIEARAKAIKQLTEEGVVFGMDATRNAQLISERTKQILEQTRGTAQQIQIAEDSTDRVLDIEKEKTSELERQQQILERQEQQRQKSIRSMEMEIQLIEAQLSGNKELEESLKQKADFETALEKTGSLEVASNFAATKAAERAAQQNPETRSSTAFFTPLAQQAAPPTMRDLAIAGDEDAMTAMLRGENTQRRFQSRVNRLLNQDGFRSAARAMNQADQRQQRDEENFAGLNRVREEGLGNNFGEGFQNFRRQFGLDSADLIEQALGENFDPTKAIEENFKRMAIEQSKTPKERLLEEQSRQGSAKQGGTASDPVAQIYALLSSHLKSIDEKLPQHAMS